MPATNRRSPCGGWHARFVPTHGVTVDDVAEQAPASALIPLTLPHWRSPQVYIVSAADHELYAELATGTYTDPERAARDAAETTEVGEVGPCRVVMPDQATTAQPTTAQPTTAQPTTAQPTTAQSATAHLATPRSATSTAAPPLPLPVTDTPLWPPTMIPVVGVPDPTVGRGAGRAQ